MEGYEGGGREDDIPPELRALRKQRNDIASRKEQKRLAKLHEEEIEQLRRAAIAEGEEPAA